jgi:hypothetical protein
MTPYRRTELHNHCFVGVGHKQDRVGYSRINRVHRLWAILQLEFFVKTQADGLGEADCYQVALEMSCNQPGFGLKSEIAIQAGLFCHKPRKTPRSVAAHLAATAVAVKKSPRPISLSGVRRNQADEAVRSDAAMAVADSHNLVAAELKILGSIIDEHKVIAGTIHLGEFHKHGWEKYRRKQKVQGTKRTDMTLQLQAKLADCVLWM